MKPRLHVILGTPAPDTPAERVRKRVRKHARPETILACPRCNGREIIEAKIGVTKRNGKLSGGTKVILCACCHRKGERVVIS